MQSCLHIVINFVRPLKPDQNPLYLSPYHWPVQNSMEFCKNVQILWKRANSRGLGQNSVFRGKLVPSDVLLVS